MPSKKPLAVIMGNGNTSHLTKAEILEREQNEIKAPSDDVKVPDYIKSKKLKEKFSKIAKQLIDLKLMSNLDCDALARYLQAESEYERVTLQLNKEQLMIEEYNEQEGKIYVVNKEYERLVIVQDKFFKQARSAASDLGLTISSRCKLVLPKTEIEKDNISEGKRRFGNRI